MKIHFLSQLAEAFGRLGYVSEGVTMVEEGFADLEPTDERVSEAELHRSRGLLHLAVKDESVAAEACFRRGIEVAWPAGSRRSCSSCVQPRRSPTSWPPRSEPGRHGYFSKR
jgi:hypothetical protein